MTDKEKQKKNWNLSFFAGAGFLDLGFETTQGFGTFLSISRAFYGSLQGFKKKDLK